MPIWISLYRSTIEALQVQRKLTATAGLVFGYSLRSQTRLAMTSIRPRSAASIAFTRCIHKATSLAYDQQNYMAACAGGMSVERPGESLLNSNTHVVFPSRGNGCGEREVARWLIGSTVLDSSPTREILHPRQSAALLQVSIRADHPCVNQEWFWIPVNPGNPINPVWQGANRSTDFKLPMPHKFCPRSYSRDT